MKDKRKPRRIIIRPMANYCRFCKLKEEPTYKKWEVLSQYISERGKIAPKARTGFCATHQRHIAREIKRARHLALLPFLVRPL
ncbi:MAG: 30S ribosomal protein S18 [Candidatus Paceibacterota bacterium]